jgi:hypothetical protein
MRTALIASATFFVGVMLSAAMSQAQMVFGGAQAVQVPVVTVAGLPTCNSTAEGLQYAVNNALTPVALSAVAGGGAVHVAVHCNGTTWIVH